MSQTPAEDEKHDDLVPATIIEAGYLRLPYEHEQFREFIRSLLGRPQSISRAIQGPFEIEPSDIQNLNELISQRVAQQNAGILANFTARVSYSDDSTVELTSVPELLSYNEVRPVSCRAIHLRWDYLVRFQDKSVPEKQSIQVSYMAGDGDIAIDGPDIIVVTHHSHFERPGFITFRIEHTARSWGADLEALLSSYFKALVKPQSGPKRWIRAHRPAISLTLAISLFAVVAIGILLTTRTFASGQLQHLRAILGAQPGVESTSSAIRYIAELFAGGVWAQFSFAAVVSLVITVFLALWVGIWSDSAASTIEPSFILLNRESHKAKAELLRKLQRKWLSFIGSIVLTVVLGIVANYLFFYLVT